jgi:hypothetical protein
MWVMGGGRTAPNPSNEVDIYDPVGGTWSLGPPFTTARRNFPTATNGTDTIWLAGGYAPATATDSMEIFGCPSPKSHAYGVTINDGYPHSQSKCHRNTYRHRARRRLLLLLR